MAERNSDGSCRDESGGRLRTAEAYDCVGSIGSTMTCPAWGGGAMTVLSCLLLSWSKAPCTVAGLDVSEGDCSLI